MNYRQFACTAIELLPDYFFTVAASSSGKYHPPYALEKGGLVRHTKAAVKFAHCLLELEQCNFTQEEKDIIIVAILLHDGWKHGNDGSAHTVAEHPTVCAAWIAETKALHDIIPEASLKILQDAIASHMGQWNTDFKAKKEILPKPSTEIQKFVHICDYLASRKFLPMDFENDYYDGTFETSSEIDDLISDIISVCKEKITGGISRDKVYSIIEEIAGVKNPNKITDVEVAKTVLTKMKELTNE